MRALQIMTPERVRLHRLYQSAIKNAREKELSKRKAEIALKTAYKRVERYKTLLYPEGINYEATDNLATHNAAAVAKH